MACLWTKKCFNLLWVFVKSEEATNGRAQYEDQGQGQAGLGRPDWRQGAPEGGRGRRARGTCRGGGRGREARRDRGGERRQTRVQRDFKVGGHVHDSLSIV